MRIVSKLKDYYDSVQGLGQDLETPYIRTYQRWSSPRRGKNVDKSLSARCMIPCFWDYSPNPTLETTGYTIGFCGKIYPLVRVEYKGKSKFCYSVDDVKTFVNAHCNDVLVEAFNSKSWRTKWVGYKLLEYNRLFSLPRIHAKYDAIFEHYECPIWVYHENQYEFWLDINPLLNQYHFQRVFDSYLAYQEIYMYLCNQARPIKEIPKIDDVTMAEAKGFNKYSFRKDKSNG